MNKLYMYTLSVIIYSITDNGRDVQETEDYNLIASDSIF